MKASSSPEGSVYSAFLRDYRWRHQPLDVIPGVIQQPASVLSRRPALRRALWLARGTSRHDGSRRACAKYGAISAAVAKRRGVGRRGAAWERRGGEGQVDVRRCWPSHRVTADRREAAGSLRVASGRLGSAGCRERGRSSHHAARKPTASNGLTAGGAAQKSPRNGAETAVRVIRPRRQLPALLGRGRRRKEVRFDVGRRPVCTKT